MAFSSLRLSDIFLIPIAPQLPNNIPSVLLRNTNSGTNISLERPPPITPTSRLEQPPITPSYSTKMTEFPPPQSPAQVPQAQFPPQSPAQVPQALFPPQSMVPYSETETAILNDPYTLRKHQKEAISWMISREQKNVGGILALQMGAGKTLIGLYQIASNLGRNEISLIVVGKTLVTEWVNDIQKFFGQKRQIRYLVMHPEYPPNNSMNKTQYKKYLDGLTYSDIVGKYDLIITTYEQVTKSMKENKAQNWITKLDERNKIIGYHKVNIEAHGNTNARGIPLLHNIKWQRVIADEIQQIVNAKTKGFLALSSLLSHKRFGFSGTPTKNRDQDFWSLLFFSGFDEIDSPKQWSYDIYLNLKDKWLFNAEIENTLPPLIEKYIIVDMDPVTSYVYRYYFSDLEEALLQFVRDNKSVLFSHILELFMRLRQISITPFLLSDNSKPKIKPQDKILETSLDRENNPENNYYARLIHDRNQVGYASAKNAAIINTLNNIVTTNDENGKPNQVLVFSSFATELELLKNYYDYNNIPSGYIRGSDPGDKRTIILNDFRIGKTKILFLQYKTGSQGLNLTAANYVLTIDPWWNSTFEDQGVSRAYRSGQTRPVTWYRFITRRSVEEPIVEMAKAKKTITESYKDISKGNVRLEIPGLNLQELLKLIEGNKKSLFS